MKIDNFLITTDWDEVSSNLELLPYYAYMLGVETAKHVPKPAEDEKLFVFAADPGWKDKLDPDTMERTKAIVAAYKAAGERILFARGRFSPETAEELSADYPGLADAQGKGWYSRHIKAIVKFGWENFNASYGSMT